MRPESIIKFDFMGSWRSTIVENICVGFLLGVSSNISGEYLTIMISSSGHLRAVFHFGFERQELIFPEKHFGLGQYHDVRITRKAWAPPSSFRMQPHSLLRSPAGSHTQNGAGGHGAPRFWPNQCYM
ncbi:neurexin-4-like [Periplaneta americana]|uniref:neurexin-4-like n=1 Tax=Periplaneta americana TaxID=6978 RepID=UPI0037E998EE